MHACTRTRTRTLYSVHSPAYKSIDKVGRVVISQLIPLFVLIIGLTETHVYAPLFKNAHRAAVKQFCTAKGNQQREKECKGCEFSDKVGFCNSFGCYIDT